MCESDPKGACQQPENLKTVPAECSPEQIKSCHGDAAGHPCEQGKQAAPLKTVSGCGCGCSGA